MQRQFLAIQTAEHKARIAEIDGQLAQKAAERDTISTMIAKIQQPFRRSRSGERPSLPL